MYRQIAGTAQAGRDGFSGVDIFTCEAVGEMLIKSDFEKIYFEAVGKV